MLPCPKQSFLHDVLGTLPVTAGQVHRVPEQRTCMLVVESTDQVFVTNRPGLFMAVCAVTNHHTKVNGRSALRVHGGARMTSFPVSVTSSPASVICSALMTSWGGKPGSVITNPTTPLTPSTLGTTEIR
jgi:hypothetical protein